MQSRQYRLDCVHASNGADYDARLWCQYHANQRYSADCYQGKQIVGLAGSIVIFGYGRRAKTLRREPHSVEWLFLYWRVLSSGGVCYNSRWRTGFNAGPVTQKCPCRTKSPEKWRISSCVKTIGHRFWAATQRDLAILQNQTYQRNRRTFPDKRGSTLNTMSVS